MRRFTPSEIRTFLSAVDRHLSTEVSITIIGGSAAALAYSVPTGTVDVDTFESDLAAYEGALTKARAETGSTSSCSVLPSRTCRGTTRLAWYASFHPSSVSLSLC